MAGDPSALKAIVVEEFLGRVWARVEEDEVFNRSAQLSYYFLLALFPLLLLVITLSGYFSGAGTHLHDQLICGPRR